jgi:hypothetical protein
MSDVHTYLVTEVREIKVTAENAAAACRMGREILYAEPASAGMFVNALTLPRTVSIDAKEA